MIRVSLTNAERAERDQRIADYTRQGYSAKQIADIEHCTMRTVARVRVKAGIAKQHAGPLTADELRIAAALLDDGASYAEVARTIGRSDYAIAKHLPNRSVWKTGGAMTSMYAALGAIPTTLRGVGA